MNKSTTIMHDVSDERNRFHLSSEQTEAASEAVRGRRPARHGEGHDLLLHHPDRHHGPRGAGDHRARPVHARRHRRVGLRHPRVTHLGFLDGIEVSLFLLILGGCLGIVNKLGALDAGIAALVKRLHGRETVLIAVIMAVFALLGSTYGFCEETIPFYGLLAATMYAAGFDTMVAAATVLLGAGVGCLGSTVNPFACGVAIDSLASVGLEVNQGVVIALGVILTVVSYLISLFFILRYANRVRRDKGSTILSLQEQQASEEAYGENAEAADGPAVLEFTGKRKVALALFGFSFAVRDLRLHPVGGLRRRHLRRRRRIRRGRRGVGDHAVERPAHGQPARRVVLQRRLRVVLHHGHRHRHPGRSARERDRRRLFERCRGHLIGVALMVGLSRAISILMGETGLDMVILNNASAALEGTSASRSAPSATSCNLGLSVVITSRRRSPRSRCPGSLGPLAANLGFPPEVIITIFCAANGLANLFSPTAVFLPGLLLARVQYPTWLKWALVPIVVIRGRERGHLHRRPHGAVGAPGLPPGDRGRPASVRPAGPRHRSAPSREPLVARGRLTLRPCALAAGGYFFHGSCGHRCGSTLAGFTLT